MSFGQKIKVFLVNLSILLFKSFEWSDFLAKNFLRIGTFTLVILAFLLGFYLESYESEFYRYFPGFATSFVKTPSKVPVLKNQIPFPEISAKSALVVDVESAKNLYELEIDSQLPPASTTKLMTAIISLELYDLDEELTASGECSEVEGSRLGLLPGEVMGVKDLMTALLINSSNDAACVLASEKIPYFDFMVRMNERAKDLGLEDTEFRNPIGLDSENNQHHSSAYDLYLLAKAALKEPFIRDTVKLKETVLKTGVVERKIYTTNHLLWAIPESYGIKTGKTLAAGEVLIYGYKRDNKDLIVVVMGSDERFLDTRFILDWVLESYSWEGY